MHHMRGMFSLPKSLSKRDSLPPTDAVSIRCTTASRSGKVACSEPPVARELIERAVLERLSGVILAEPNVTRLVELTNEYLSESASMSHDVLASIRSRLNDVRSCLRRLYEVIETGELSVRDLALRLKELRSEEEELVRDEAAAVERSRRNVAARVETEVVLAYLADLRGLLESGSPVQRRQFIAAMVKKVVKNGKSVRIEYLLPLPADAASLGGQQVPPTVRPGGAGGIRTPYLFDANEALSQLSYSPGFTCLPAGAG
jgi:hypothetical protein